jgi:hypothetical protein
MEKQIYAFIHESYPNMKRSYTYALAVFFSIKIKLEDWDGNICAPSHVLWKKWRKIVQSTRFYQEMCRRFSDGEMINFHCNDEDFNRSYLTTYLLAKHYYEELDTSIWAYPTILKLPRSILYFKRFYAKEPEMHISYKKGQTMADLKTKLRKKLKLEPNHPILLFRDGETFISENEQAEQYDGKEKECVVHFYLDQGL